MYSPSAFVCRYFYCGRASDGFDSAKQRNLHEAIHQPQFRCAFPSCVGIAIGFSTKNALKRHNETYHASIHAPISLADAISRALSPHEAPIARRTTSSEDSDPNTSSQPDDTNTPGSSSMDLSTQAGDVGLSRGVSPHLAGLFPIGKMGGGGWVCQYGHCQVKCNDSAAIQIHFERTHATFTPIESVLLYICLSCQQPRSTSSTYCRYADCGAYGPLVASIYGKNNVDDSSPTEQIPYKSTLF
jgi:hypothetical protein